MLYKHFLNIHLLHELKSLNFFHLYVYACTVKILLPFQTAQTDLGLRSIENFSLKINKLLCVSMGHGVRKLYRICPRT